MRGLSSLLILRRLLKLVTAKLIERTLIPETHPIIEPQEVFDIAVGTSTGGSVFCPNPETSADRRPD